MKGSRILDHYNFVRVEEAEMDEQWSYVGNTSNQRWLWHHIDHVTGKVLAYVFGKRKDTVFKKLQALLAPFGLIRFYTNDWGAYERNLDEKLHEIGKANTQKAPEFQNKNKTFNTKNHLLFKTGIYARYCDWLVYQSRGGT